MTSSEDPRKAAASAAGDDPVDRLLFDHFRPAAPPPDLAARAIGRAQETAERARALIGRLRVEATPEGVARVDLDAGHAGVFGAGAAARRIGDQAREELGEYFEGRRTFFSVPVDFGGAPEFQRRILRAAVSIPFGEARSYAWVADHAGNPRAVRAAGTALGRNPVPFIVPCHRVVRTGGGLGGYGLGLPLKKWLLDLELHTPVLEGNATTHYVCRLGCSGSPRTLPENRVVFAAVEDALSVGFRACETCLPEAASRS